LLHVKIIPKVGLFHHWHTGNFQIYSTYNGKKVSEAHFIQALSQHGMINKKIVLIKLKKDIKNLRTPIFCGLNSRKYHLQHTLLSKIFLAYFGLLNFFHVQGNPGVSKKYYLQIIPFNVL
jgi:hypothetical protein